MDSGAGGCAVSAVVAAGREVRGDARAVWHVVWGSSCGLKMLCVFLSLKSAAAVRRYRRLANGRIANTPWAAARGTPTPQRLRTSCLHACRNRAAAATCSAMKIHLAALLLDGIGSVTCGTVQLQQVCARADFVWCSRQHGAALLPAFALFSGSFSAGGGCAH